jgi:transcriptional antiterminator RfaH
MKQWYVVYTHAQAEQIAQTHLERQGFTVYCPRIRKTRRHARRVMQCASPLFPRYLFVNLDREHCRWRAVRSTIGVSALLSRGDEPLLLDPAVLDRIRDREGEDGLIRLDDDSAPDHWRPGTPLHIHTGPLADCDGLFQGLGERDRVRVLLELLGRPVMVTVPAQAVRLGA